MINKLSMCLSADWQLSITSEPEIFAKENTVTQIVIDNNYGSADVAFNMDIKAPYTDPTYKVMAIDSSTAQLYVSLTNSDLTRSGPYSLQLVGTFTDGSVKKSNTVTVKVKSSINATDQASEAEVTAFSEALAAFAADLEIVKGEVASFEITSDGYLVTYDKDGNELQKEALPSGGGGTGGITEAQCRNIVTSYGYATASEVNTAITSALASYYTKSDLSAVVSNSHSHSNKAVLDGITADAVSEWNASEQKAHEHSNKSVLDAITSALTTAWKTASDWVSTNGTNILNHLSNTTVHITSAERTAWDGKQDALTTADKQAIADLHKDAVTSVNGQTGDVKLTILSESDVNTLIDTKLAALGTAEGSEY